jgi:hypothetical protein
MLKQIGYHFVTVAAALQEARRPTKHLRVAKLFAFESFLQNRFCFRRFVSLTKGLAHNFSNQRLANILGSQLLLDSFWTIAARFSSGPCPVPRKCSIVKVIQRTKLFQRPFGDGSGVISLD